MMGYYLLITYKNYRSDCLHSIVIFSHEDFAMYYYQIYCIKYFNIQLFLIAFYFKQMYSAFFILTIASIFID